jgi:chorismate mutase / prephenate dehydratase
VIKEVVGIQGSLGAFHEAAATQMLGAGVEIAYIPTFEALFDALHKQEIGSAVTAIANVNVGFIDEPHEELVENGSRYWIADETYVPVAHQLLGLPGASIDDIKAVHTMGPAFQQCTHSLHRLLPDVIRIEEEDTARSAEIVGRLADPSHAAIASTRAGELNGLAIIKGDLQDNGRNITRFLHIKLRSSGKVKLTGMENKTTILLDIPDIKGSLFKALGAFWLARINISMLHSSFVEDSDFNERFFMEFDAGLGSRQSKIALRLLRRLGCKATVLGSYVKQPLPNGITGKVTESVN